MGEEHQNPRTPGEEVRIGDVLRKARRDLGLSHEDAEEATRIRRRYLEALERDDYGALPGAVYARGFLKTYGDYLGLDGSSLARGLKDLGETPPGGSEETAGVRRRGLVLGGSAGRPALNPDADLYGRKLPGRRASAMPVIGSVLVLLMVGLMIGGLYYVGQRVIQSSISASPEVPADEQPGDPGQVAGDAGEPAETPPADPPEEVAEEPGASGEGDPPDAGGASPPPEKLLLEVRVEDNISWLSVKTDGDTAYEQVAQPGFSQTFEAREVVSVWSGNAGAVRIEVNGQDYGPLGDSGEVKTRDFTLKTAES
jgi:transcriptional regulator with XRE-family HTH domain